MKRLLIVVCLSAVAVPQLFASSDPERECALFFQYEADAYGTDRQAYSDVDHFAFVRSHDGFDIDSNSYEVLIERISLERFWEHKQLTLHVPAESEVYQQQVDLLQDIIKIPNSVEHRKGLKIVLGEDSSSSPS